VNIKRWNPQSYIEEDVIPASIFSIKKGVSSIRQNRGGRMGSHPHFFRKLKESRVSDCLSCSRDNIDILPVIEEGAGMHVLHVDLR
jgi:hypothetical protein